jgi:hypothetical protein
MPDPVTSAMTGHELAVSTMKIVRIKRIPLPIRGNRWLFKAPDQIQSPFQNLIARPNMAKYDLIPAAGKPAQKRENSPSFFPFMTSGSGKKGKRRPYRARITLSRNPVIPGW